jgi:uroporphyrinogen decarboxylase
MRRLSDAVARYLVAQIDAGVEAVQLFDSWVGALGPGDYARYVQPHVASIFRAIGDRVPAIHFGTGNPALHPLMKEAGGHVLGVDQRADLAAVRRTIGGPVQGNLDPVALLAPRETMLRKADEVLRAAGSAPGHVFNLGHGVLPGADVAQVRALVEHVQRSTAR